MTEQSISVSDFANIMGVSRATIHAWERKGVYTPQTDDSGGKHIPLDAIKHLPQIREMLESAWEIEFQTRPLRPYSSIELFAGAGGLALGEELAGIEHKLLCEIDRDACRTLNINRPNWNVAYADVRDMDWKSYRGKIDLLSGGFPCQAFSYAGKQGGFADTRGTLFFELARATDEIRPSVLLAENVRGLVAHDQGRTLSTIRGIIDDLGYNLVEPQVLQAIKYQVPQKRERLILVAVRKDLCSDSRFVWPSPYHRIMTLRDAFFAGELYPTDVPNSLGAVYPLKKKAVLDLVPMGGDWRDLPIETQKEYMGASFYLGGGKTGMARRLSLDEPSLTLTCSPAQKQTERCHPLETRPLSVREYARIQTFPDNWIFAGSMASQYKQIGNAVPVNFAWAISRALVRLLNDIDLTQ